MYVLSIDGSETEFNVTVEQAVLSMGKNPDSYIYLVGSEPIPMDTVPSDCKVRAVRVASGG